MKLASLSALLTCIALTAPLGAQAAMDAKTQEAFMNDCLKTAGQSGITGAQAKAHCECGAQQVNNLSQKEIDALNAPSTTDEKTQQALATKLQQQVAAHCVKQKN